MMNSRHELNITPALGFVKCFDWQSREREQEELTGMDRIDRIDRIKKRTERTTSQYRLR
jgi:hypothetical protein